MAKELEIHDVSGLITNKIKLLERGRGEIQEKANWKSEAISNYKRKLAVVLIQLEEGEPMSLDGHVTKNPRAASIKDIAKGICWEERLALEQATAEYTLTVAKMRSIEAELNGFQSIFRHLEKIAQ